MTVRAERIYSGSDGGRKGDSARVSLWAWPFWRRSFSTALVCPRRSRSPGLPGRELATPSNAWPPRADCRARKGLPRGNRVGPEARVHRVHKPSSVWSATPCTPCTQPGAKRGSATPRKNHPQSRKEGSGEKIIFFLPVAKHRAPLVYTVYTRF